MTRESGRRFAGRTSIDATYEADLMAEAGVPFTVGPAANATYGETLNGVQTRHAVSHWPTTPACRRRSAASSRPSAWRPPLHVAPIHANTKGGWNLAGGRWNRGPDTFRAPLFGWCAAEVTPSST